MSKRLSLLEMYTSIISFAGGVVDKEGFVSIQLEDELIPLLVSGKRLVLPTREHLAAGDSDNKMIFHPLHENFLQTQSDVISKLRTVFNIRLNYVFSSIARSLLYINSSIAMHPKLSPEQSEMLSFIKDVDEKTVVNFTSLLLAQTSADRSFLNVYLRAAGTLGDHKYSRVGVVTFPLMEELEKEQDKYFGVKLRVKDRAALIQLYNYIFPNLTTANYYSRGSDSDVAPYLDALMQTVKAVASKFNDITTMFGKHIEGCEQLLFTSDWVDSFSNLVAYLPEIRMIPMQAGNDGKSQVQPAAPEVQPATLPTTQFNNAPLPWQTHQQQQWQPPAQQNSAVIVTSRGVDFQSMLRANPNLAQQAMSNNNGNNNQPQQQMRAPPTWARNNNGYNNGNNNNNYNNGNNNYNNGNNNNQRNNGGYGNGSV